jgi:hypothetical protein
VVLAVAAVDIPLMELVVELEALEEAAVDHGKLPVVPEQLQPMQQEI